ncbi:HD-GYP domain-containing protein [Salirhabdus salicampi]|uniref:HD-GYP domain-containing protein n=1 Tax=Salirhabdus salicampi TaxID=476102 RepID=UPI0020C21AD6|nr:HD-GYP domain-containing protein [Salirhabdus salicampi]MCP8616245.1 HD-GYP domain-containing protein [Salirhabdus salicampi]
MRLIRVDHCDTGMTLGKTIYNERGSVLLAQGTELHKGLLKKLTQHGIHTIYIEDDLSEGIEVIDSIPIELRNEAVQVITEGLNTITSTTSNKNNLQNMMKSGRVVRSINKVFKDILSCLRENRTAINLLASTKIHDNYVYSHSVNVAIYSCQLALENGLLLKNIEEIGLGAMLHDVGKMYIDPNILNKPGKLTMEEYEEVKKHSELGYQTLRKIHEIPLPVAHCALQHHERIDGKGYPRGIIGEEIHNYSKILSVADVFDAVTSHRVYRPAVLPHKALELLYSGSGTQFESKQVQLFKGCIAIYPEGLTVKLDDGRTGIVSKYNFHAVGRPQIRIIKNEEDKEVIPYEIDLATNENLSLEIVEAAALL